MNQHIRVNITGNRYLHNFISFGDKVIFIKLILFLVLVSNKKNESLPLSTIKKLRKQTCTRTCTCNRRFSPTYTCICLGHLSVCTCREPSTCIPKRVQCSLYFLIDTIFKKSGRGGGAIYH